MNQRKLSELISDLISGLDIPVKICFISGIISGLSAHIYALVNHLYNYDEIWWTPAGIGTGIEHGRFGLSVIGAVISRLFTNTYTLPVINGIIAILMYTIAACLVVNAFNINDKIYSATTGSLFVVFPAVVSRMFYMYTTHAYAIGVLCAVFSSWFIIKFHKKWYQIIIAVLFLAFGTSVYQANFASAVCVIVGFLITDLIKNDDSLVKPAIMRCISYLSFLVSGLILYFILNKLFLKLSGREMAAMEGYNTMGHLSPSDILRGIKSSYTQFVRFCYGNVYSTNPTIITKAAFLAAFIIFAYAFILIIRNKMQPVIKLITLLLFIVMPVAINLIVIMAASTDVMYTIMRFEPVFIFAIAGGVIDELTSENAHITPPARNFPLLLHNIYSICLIASVLVYIWFANGNYLALQYTNEHDYAYFTAVMTQIKSTTGYRDDMPVIFMGHPVNDSTNDVGAMINDTFNIGGKRNTNLTAYSGIRIFRVNLGFDPEIKNSDEDEEYFTNHPAVKNMPCYPDSGSIAIIDDTVVVKFEGDNNDE